jgi:peptidoglycan/xylan/chitin deacetylase (PgdA/CDA1 family)
MAPTSYTPPRSMPARIQRRLVQWRSAAPVRVESDRPVVSFTFDDFPKSAVNGADVIEAEGGRACFYACTSMLGGVHADMGEMYDADTVADLILRGHEIGAHTHTHLDCAREPLAKVQRDVSESLVALTNLGFTQPVASFAWPYGETKHAAKQWASEVFATSRGVLPGVNAGAVDRGQLRAVELGDSQAHRDRAMAMLRMCVESKGWLIFFTHDVSTSPTPYGCTPDLLRDLARAAQDQGAVLAAPSLAAALCGIID